MAKVLFAVVSGRDSLGASRATIIAALHPRSRSHRALSTSSTTNECRGAT
jgi:hypothetical protein